MDRYPGGFKSEINFALESEWEYVWYFMKCFFKENIWRNDNKEMFL